MAVELSLITPVILLMFFAIVEFTDAILAKRRLGVAASMMTDLVTNRSDYWLHEDEAADVMTLIAESLAPYSLTDITARITAVTWDAASAKPVVVWSVTSTPEGGVVRSAGAGYAAGAPFGKINERHYLMATENIIGGDEHVLVGELDHPFTSRLTNVVLDAITLTAQEVRRPRREDVLEYCTDAGCTDGDDWNPTQLVPGAAAVG